jgi:integrase
MASITFDEAARRYLLAKGPEFRNPKHLAQWASTLNMYASPVIGNLDVALIQLPQIQRVLEPLWSVKTETASRLRGRIERVLDWAAVSGYRTGDNPARWVGNLKEILPAAKKITRVRHHAALSRDQLPAFVATLASKQGMAARALEFAIITAARSGEVRGATWAEIDTEAGVWKISAERMKASRPHTVPLSRHALRLLESLPRIAGTDLVFPNRSGKALSDSILSKLVRSMPFHDAAGQTITPHGFRSTFKDWARATKRYPDEASELALAHVNSDETRSAYARDELLDMRAQMMRDWARFIYDDAGKRASRF